jgi:hypothetical protein
MAKAAKPTTLALLATLANRAWNRDVSALAWQSCLLTTRNAIQNYDFRRYLPILTANCSVKGMTAFRLVCDSDMTCLCHLYDSLV